MSSGLKHINLDHNGNLGNKIFQYIFCLEISRLVPGCVIGGLSMPEFGLVSPDLPLIGRTLYIKDGHQHNIRNIAYKLRSGIYKSLLFGGYVQRIEHYPDREYYNAIFRSDIKIDDKFLGPRYITVNIRGKEVLRATHPDYNPVPISFFEKAVNESGLEPVIMGQLGDNFYADAIRKRFSGCIFVENRSALEDFQFIRRSSNVVFGVSTFSWWATYLSNVAEKIYMPLRGIFNPKQRPDIDLLPISDHRYRFYQFPVERWTASTEQLSDLTASESNFFRVTAEEVACYIQ